MYKRIMVALAALALSGPALADAPVGLTISPMVGQTWLDDLDDESHWQIGVGYQFDNPWAVELTYSALDTESTSDVPAIKTDVTRWHVDALYHLEAMGKVRPYLAAGLGYAEYDFAGLDNDERLFNAGVGLKYGLSDNLALRGDWRFFSVSDIDDLQSALSVGLHYTFAAPQKAAPRPMPAKPAPIADADGDGVPDNRDRCPTSAAGSRVNADGCADSDGDGVLDRDDRCANTPAGVKVGSRGCPLDDDADGVANHLDRCPDTTNRKARIDEVGCYVVLEQDVSVDLNVQFANNSAEVGPEHLAEARRVQQFMQEYPSSVVTIEGHTDDRGRAAYNKDLSQRRANAIAGILIDDLGVDRSRVTAIGYGEERPVADNNTAEGRQTNRRVVGVVTAKAGSVAN